MIRAPQPTTRRAGASRRGGSLLRAAGRRRKGASLIWFLVVMVPVMFFVCAITVDLARMYVAHRSVTDAAIAAAQAGAEQFTTGGSLRTGASTTAAVETFRKELAVNAIPGGIDIVSMRVASARASTTVTVTIRYRMTDMIFTSFFGGTGAASHVFTANAQAYICRPGQAGPTAGYCQAPPTYHG